MNHAVGAWSAKKTPLLGSPVWKTFDEVFSKLLGCEYILTAYYEQVVAGTHYCFEVEVKPITQILYQQRNGLWFLNRWKVLLSWKASTIRCQSSKLPKRILKALSLLVFQLNWAV